MLLLQCKQGLCAHTCSVEHGDCGKRPRHQLVKNACSGSAANYTWILAAFAAAAVPQIICIYIYIYIYIYLYRRQRRSCIAADKLQHIDIELRPSISVVVEN